MAASLDRRTFLRRAGLAGAAAVMATGAPRPPARADETLTPFQWGVASGDPLDDRVVLWTRVDPTVGSSVEVGWTIATDVALNEVVASGTVTTDASRDHTVKVDAVGLSPGTYYFYAFEVGGRSSLVGRTKTAPSGPTERLRFGMVSCSNYTGGYFNAYSRLAERNDLDAILHLGDYIYEYGNTPESEGGDRYGPDELAGERDHQPPHEPITLADYRLRHGNYKLDPDLRRLHQLFPFITTWDDHETTDNSWRDGAVNHDPEDDPDWEGTHPEGDWETRKAVATQAYAEWMPIRSPFADTTKIWRSFTYGDLAEIIVMDTRLQDRDAPAAGVTDLVDQDPNAPFQGDLDDPERRMVSDEQRQFVFDRLSTSDATWKLLAQQVMMMQWKAGGLPTVPSGAGDAPMIVTPGGTPVNGDAWDGYPAERARFFAHIRDNGIDNTVVLTGDIHSSWAADLTEDPYRADTYNPVTGEGALGVEFVCPSVTSDSMFKLFGYPYRSGSIAIEEASKADNPHIKFVEGDTHGYVVLDLTPERTQAQWWSAHDVLSPEHTHELMAVWEVQAGANHLNEGAEAAGEQAGAPAAPPADPPQDGSASEPQPEEPSLPTTGGGALVGGLAALAAAGALRLRSRGGADDPADVH